ncbi:GlsB/YeaQ/YmgE family stress response membrane protein [Streptomyces spiramenti]|uniref:GlsB/YeaQ/YmgE family stress response membrane protein n=1 Tax=Streptomyces spiramenti TaxID=2720606 RepID=A0ABX1AKJ5_9ACTN|nr:GlsB/YeaQ/YmgE family stress response membrane protein [Streptomyces spiramenti]NJP66526.1 GlsB/YeaQ/YmgE family stress response membrane protein [Streptomyces spiramenti]
MSVIAWIVIGLIAGAIAKAVLPGRANFGIILTAVLGIAGGLLGGWLGVVIFGVGVAGFFSLSTWICAIVGSLILLGLYGMVTGRTAHHGGRHQHA